MTTNYGHIPMKYCQLQPMKPLYMDTKFLVLKKVCYSIDLWLRLSCQRSCDHIQWFQWLQVVILHGYVTLVWCHMLWSSQKCLEVLIIAANVVHNFSCHPLYNVPAFLDHYDNKLRLMSNRIKGLKC